jgi:hypothetical protein
MSSKTLLLLEPGDFDRLHQETHPETGMNLCVVESGGRITAITGDGASLPCYPDNVHFDLPDLLAGVPPPERGLPNFNLPSTFSVFPNRLQAAAAIAGSLLSPPTPTGAKPLLARRTLMTPTTFYRYISSPTDLRFVAGNLLPGTYLTTTLEHLEATSGFAAVGRFALPLPIPASNVIQYMLPPTTILDVGTVSPLFGQAGGGVEVCIVSSSSATQVGFPFVPDY